MAECSLYFMFVICEPLVNFLIYIYNSIEVTVLEGEAVSLIVSSRKIVLFAEGNISHSDLFQRNNSVSNKDGLLYAIT